MAATNYTPIQLYRTTTAAATPSAVNLADGELAINLTDEKLYFKNAGGSVKLLASSAGASGSVTSVGGTGTVNGITLTGTVTSSGSLTLGGTLSGVSLTTQVTGTLPVANGGTGATTLTGYVKGSGTSAFTASATIPGSDISGNISGNAANVTGTVAVANGGTGATTLTGYVKGSGTSAFTASATIPGSDISGNISGNAANVTGTVAVANGGTGATSAAAARTNLGATTVGANVFTLTNPSAITFLQINADNTVSALDAASFRTAIGAGSGGGTVTSVSGTGSVNGITLTGTVTSSGSLTLGGTLSGVSLTTQVSGTLPAANGGTGQSSYTVGDILYASTTSALSKLAGVATGNALISGGTGTAPSWGKIGLTTHVSGTLAVANGGTGVTTSTGTGNNVLSASPTFTGTVTTATADLLGSVRGNVTAVAASAVDCSAGNYFTKTATGALTWTFTNAPATRAYSFLLELTNGGTGTQTWPASVDWPGGTAPTLTTSGVDVLGFITDDGGTIWRGVQLMKDSK